MRLESKLTVLEQRVLALRDRDLPPWANDGGSLAFNAIRLSLAVRTDEEYRQHLRLARRYIELHSDNPWRLMLLIGGQTVAEWKRHAVRTRGLLDARRGEATPPPAIAAEEPESIEVV